MEFPGSLYHIQWWPDHSELLISTELNFLSFDFFLLSLKSGTATHCIYYLLTEYAFRTVIY